MKMPMTTLAAQDQYVEKLEKFKNDEAELFGGRCEDLTSIGKFVSAYMEKQINGELPVEVNALENVTPVSVDPNYRPSADAMWESLAVNDYESIWWTADAEESIWDGFFGELDNAIDNQDEMLFYRMRWKFKTRYSHAIALAAKNQSPVVWNFIPGWDRFKREQKLAYGIARGWIDSKAAQQYMHD